MISTDDVMDTSQDRYTDVHVMPVNDLRPHYVSRACWCHPTEDEEDVWLHFALDGRSEALH